MQSTETDVLISTTESIPGYETKKYVGLVWSTSARTLDSISELGAVLKSLAGGELPAFRKLLNEGRYAVLRDLAAAAKLRGANAIIGVKLESATIMGGTVEVYAYGTAVVVEKAKPQKK